MDWQLADAKNRFSELVRRALADGPQRVRRRNDAVVVLSEKDFEELKGGQTSFAAFLTQVPDLSGLALARDDSPMRNTDL